MRRLFKFVIFAGLVFGVAGSIALSLVSRTLPELNGPEDYKPWVMSEVYAEDGQKIGEFYEHRRKLMAMEDIPAVVKQAFIAAEDAYFYSHRGIDLRAIARALVINFKAGRKVQGGSTITMQVARSEKRLTREKKYTRKIKEAILAMKLEGQLTKDEILYLYLNEIYLGHGAYGVEAAAQNYFGKSVKNLTLAEAAIIAGLPQAPSRYSPLIHPEMAKERQLYVLRQMVGSGYISKKEAVDAAQEVLKFLVRKDFNLDVAPYFVEHIRRHLLEKYGYNKIMREGIQIYTTLNVDAQKAANMAVEQGLRDVDKRIGFRGPLEHLENEQAIRDFIMSKERPEILEDGKIYKAVITEVNDEEKRVIASLKAVEVDAEGVAFEQQASVSDELSDEEKEVVQLEQAQQQEDPFPSVKGQIPFKEMRWARKENPNKYYMNELLQVPSDALAVGDVVYVRVIEKMEGPDSSYHINLEQTPVVEGALYSFEPHTGFIRAMVGGLDYERSEFNRVIQGQRQIGSVFKPIVYGAALDNGYTPASIIVDSPIIYREGEKEIEDQWKPRNYAEKFYGDTILANGLAYSRNIVTIKIVQDIKIDKVIEFARKLGVTSPLIEDLSMALGSSSMTLDEVCRVFSAYAAKGKKVEPVFITKIVDRDGNILEEYQPPEARESIISEELAYLMTHLLSGVVKRGTGRSVKDLGWTMAAKTGTTSDYADAWFVGFSPDLLTGVWVGHDQRRKIAEYESGAKTAIPIWKAYMKAALEKYEKREFDVPEGIIFVNIDQENGKLASKDTRFDLSSAFIEGTEPQEEKKSSRKVKRRKQEDTEFFKEDF